MLVRYDARVIGALVMDDNTIKDPVSLLTDPTLLTLLTENSGKLEATIFGGGRYTPLDLATILANPPPNTQIELLCGMVADMTIVRLYGRRVNMMMPRIPMVEETQGFLRAFAEGVNVFGLQDQIDAGREEDQVENLQDVINRNDPSWQARRYFGRRAKWVNQQGTGCYDQGWW
jgi:hypothetical protein